MSAEEAAELWEVKTWVEHNTSGLFSQGDITDRPSPAITISQGSTPGSKPLAPLHFRVHYYLTRTPPMTDAPPPGAKPPYRVPSMAEIAARPRNGYKAVSTFSGCGGSSLGYKMAGFELLWANEFIPAAQDTYRANHPGTILDTRDIRQVRPEEILAAIGLKEGELDLYDGSPPCASFSTAGKREKGWGVKKKYSDTEQRVDDLFFEYTRLLRGLMPKVFVAENVSGLLKGTATGMFKEILRELRAPGYKVEARLLDAQWLGVPQMRQRVIFVGVRQDLVDRYGVAPAYPKPLPYNYSVRDALPWVVKVGHAGNVDHPSLKWKGSELPSPTVVQSGASLTEGAYLSGGAWIEARRDPETGESLRLPPSRQGEEPTWPARDIDPDKPSHPVTQASPGNDLRVPVNPFPIEERASMEGFAVGEEWDKLKPGERSERYFNLERAHPDRPSGTITSLGAAYTTAAAAGVAHPTEKRKFSIGELRRICGFPDDFVLTGTYEQQWERLGRAVPPVMMSHIARAVAEEILDRCR